MMPTTGQIAIDPTLQKESRILDSAQHFERLITSQANYLDTLVSILSYLGGSVLGLLMLLKLLHYF